MTPNDLTERFTAGLAQSVSSLAGPELAAIADELVACYHRKSTVYVLGNGGSASTASHLAADLGKFATFPRPGFRAVCPSDNVSLATAWINDESWESLYERMLDPWVASGDVVVCFSVHGGSGWSSNLVRALSLARSRGATTIGLAGAGGGQFRNVCDHLYSLPEFDRDLTTPLTEGIHVVAHHLICALVHSKLNASSADVHAGSHS